MLMSFDRRTALAQLTCAGLSGWFGQLAQAAAKDPLRKRSCILLWMNGGPSTIDLWDNWAVFALFTLLITMEWILRKVGRMI